MWQHMWFRLTTAGQCTQRIFSRFRALYFVRYLAQDARTCSRAVSAENARLTLYGGASESIQNYSRFRSSSEQVHGHRSTSRGSNVPGGSVRSSL